MGARIGCGQGWLIGLFGLADVSGAAKRVGIGASRVLRLWVIRIRWNGIDGVP